MKRPSEIEGKKPLIFNLPEDFSKIPPPIYQYGETVVRIRYDREIDQFKFHTLIVVGFEMLYNMDYEEIGEDDYKEGIYFDCFRYHLIDIENGIDYEELESRIFPTKEAAYAHAENIFTNLKSEL